MQLTPTCCSACGEEISPYTDCYYDEGVVLCEVCAEDRDMDGWRLIDGEQAAYQFASSMLHLDDRRDDYR